jgi:hypothetical protein
MKTNIFLAHARRHMPDRVFPAAIGARPDRLRVPIRPPVAGGRLVCRWRIDATTGGLNCRWSLEDGATDVDASPRTARRVQTMVRRTNNHSFEPGCRKAA